MKTIKNQLNISILNKLMARWNISARLLSKEMEMPESTFKLKLSESQPLYCFTPVEYIKVLGIIYKMGTELNKTATTELRLTNKLLTNSKK